MTSLSRTGWLSIAAALMSLLALSPCMAQTHEFNVPAQSATTGIPEFARQAGIQILVAEKAVHGQRTAAVIGTFSVQDGLSKLIAGTRLVLGRVDSQSITLLSELPNSDPPKSAVSPDAKEASGTSGPPIAPTGATNDQNRNSPSNEAGTNRAAQLEEVTVTGSRLPHAAKDGAQEVKLYTRQNIEQSGQTTVADFLNTLPEASVSVSEANEGFNSPFSTTVQLHGLPLGTTLVLINGRRIEESGITGGAYFDLNNLPLAALERIEVLPQGSSAIYGADAIAGVVNIILRTKFSGFEANAKYGAASGTDETAANVAWGKVWDRGSVSVVGSFQTRSELIGSDRSLTATSDYTAYGGIDGRVYECNPGNVFTIDGSILPGGTSSFAAVSPSATGNPKQTGFNGTYGSLNKCDLNHYSTIIPATQREGLLVQANYKVTPSIDLFSELLLSRRQELNASSPPGMFGQPGFTPFTVASSNPFNPFGETVGVTELFTSVGRTENHFDQVFVRPLIGMRGSFLDSWEWEVAGWESADTFHRTLGPLRNHAAVQNALNSADPTMALDPFVAGSPGSPQLLQSLLYQYREVYSGQLLAANAFVRGPVLELPTGHIDAVVGAEFNHNKSDYELFADPVFSAARNTFTRGSHSVFGEVKIPIVGNRGGPQAGDVLSVTLADRYDHYDDFGSKSTPQFSAEWRPLESLLVRGSYGKAFKAPTLNELDQQQATFDERLIDPLTGQPVIASVTFGGNPKLRPETGQSRTLGFVYSDRVSGLEVSVTNWKIDEIDSIQAFNSPQTLVDNASLFPGAVVRNSAGVITQVNSLFENFGRLDVEGMDYKVTYNFQSRLGTFRPAVTATQTYRYTEALTPGSPSINAVSVANDNVEFAPRWKGSATLDWNLNQFRMHLDGRYVGKYQDYDSTDIIGNFWLCDLNLRYSIGQLFLQAPRSLESSYIELGGVNIFNRLPQYSNFGFGGVGFDPNEADIRGRFLYVQVGLKW
jgi:iron complex outermembrane receptor protein